MDGPDTNSSAPLPWTCSGRKGLRFTMQQLAQKAAHQQKTLYTCYASKEALASGHDRRCLRGHSRPETGHLWKKISPLRKSSAGSSSPCRRNMRPRISAAWRNWREKFPLRRSRSGCIWRPAGEPTLALLEETRQVDFCGRALDILRTQSPGPSGGLSAGRKPTAQEYANALETMIDIFLEGVLKR